MLVSKECGSVEKVWALKLDTRKFDSVLTL